MSFQINVQCYPWDLVDEGIDTVLDRLKGEAGVTGITVPISCGPVEQLRPHAGVSPRTFRSRGGVQFQPDASHYAGTRIRPVVADWLRKSNPLTAIAEACAKHGLSLRGSLQCCHSPITVERYETCAVKDVFGDINPTWLCPVNPDVREYLRSLVREIDSTYHPEGMELDSLWFPTEIPGWLLFDFQKWLTKPPSQIPVVNPECIEDAFGKLGGIGEWLHSLCFCESCRQAANRDKVDIFAAARSATVVLEKIFATGETQHESLEQLVNGDPVLSAFVDWRCEQIKSLLSLLRESCGCRLAMLSGVSYLTSGIEYPSQASNIDAICCAVLELDDGLTKAIVDIAVHQLGDAGRVELEIDICKSACPDSATLVRAVAQTATLGIRRISVSNYGEMPLNRLAWIKQAARYVHREFA